MDSLKTIKLNIGGKLFETTQDTLNSSSYFNSMFSRWNDSDKITFIDRSPKIFHHVLCLLRDPNYDYPVKYLSELDFYGIKYSKEEQEDLLQEISRKLDELIDYHKCKQCKSIVEDNICTSCKKRTYCWDSDACVVVNDNLISSNKVIVGDSIKTSIGKYVKVLDILPSFRKEVELVRVKNILFTSGHPIHHDGQWKRADSINSEKNTFTNFNLINFILEDVHEINVYSRDGKNKVEIATMGRFGSELSKRTMRKR